MQKQRWDECCPHCGEKINIYEMWVDSADYATTWQDECPHCDKMIQVEVVSVPEFGLSVPETKEYPDLLDCRGINNAPE